jgi:hypothetical protein
MSIICFECKKEFEPSRVDQKFCSVECSKRYRNRKYYKNKQNKNTESKDVIIPLVEDEVKQIVLKLQTQLDVKYRELLPQDFIKLPEVTDYRVFGLPIKSGDEALKIKREHIHTGEENDVYEQTYTINVEYCKHCDKLLFRKPTHRSKSVLEKQQLYHFLRKKYNF